MAYVKQTWENGDIITANKLNHMEDGIENADSGGGSLELIHVTASDPVVDGNTKTYTLTIQETGTEILAMEAPVVLATVPSDVASLAMYQLSNGLRMIFDEGSEYDWLLKNDAIEVICTILILPNGNIAQSALIITEAQT